MSRLVWTPNQRMLMMRLVDDHHLPPTVKTGVANVMDSEITMTVLGLPTGRAAAPKNGGSVYTRAVSLHILSFSLFICRLALKELKVAQFKF